MSEVTLASRLRFEDPTIARIERRPEGERLSDLVALALPGATEAMLGRVVVTLVSPKGEMIIDRADWRRVMTRAGCHVDIHLPLAGSGVLRTIISFAVLAVSAFASALFLPLLGAAFLPGTIGNAVGSAVISAGAGYLTNTLIGVSNKNTEQPEQRYAVTGTRNRVDPWGTVPVLRGEMRVYPPYAVMPHTEVVGDELHYVGVFLIGEGPHSLRSWRIGNTALEKFAVSGFELRAGWPTDEPLTLVTECIFEEPGMGVELKQVDGWVTRRTAPRTESISIDLCFQAGLSSSNDEGEIGPEFVVIELRYQRAVDGSEDPDDADWIYLDPITVFEQKLYTFWVSRRWMPADGPGEYWVEMRRYNEDRTNGKSSDAVTWSALRSIRHQYPIAYPRPLALAAVKVRGVRQFNGVLDQFNLIASSVVPDWDGSAWPLAESKNPASLSRDVLLGSHNALARQPEQINGDEFAEWHGWNVSKGLTYSRYHDFKSPLRQAFSEIAAAGRASPTQFGGKWSVVIDRPQTVTRGHISQRNAHSLGGEPLFYKLPDAWRVKFLNRARNWQADEIIVRRPDLVGDPVLFEEKEFPGYDTEELNIRAGRRLFAELALRRERFYASQQLEHLFAPRGSLVQYNYPVLDEQMVSARVIEIVNATVGGVPKKLVSLDSLVEMVTGTEYAVRFQREDGTSSLWTIETTPGVRSVVTLIDGPSAPAAGDLAFFGRRGYEAQECIVKSMEGLRGLSARLVLVPHAPEIEAIADDDVPIPPPPTPSLPPWAGRAPSVPTIVDLRSGSDEVILGEVGSPLIVHLRTGGGGVPVDHFVCTAQRGAETPISKSVPAWSGRAVFNEFAVGNNISVTATAVTAYGIGSAACPPKTHVIKARTDVPADLVDLDFEAFSSGQRRFSWGFDPDATADQVDRITGYRLRFRPGSGWSWADMAAGADIAAIGRPLDTVLPLTAGPHTVGIVAFDRAGRLSVNPWTADFTLPATSAAVVATRIESTEGWDGTLTEGTIETDGLEGVVGIAYELPVIDLGADLPFEVQAIAYGVAGTASIRMTIGLDADGAPVGSDRALGIATARYVGLAVTVTNPDDVATLGDLVTIVTPA